ncbi:MAG: thioredoxin family protein [Hyphomicrobiaceae bacterium]|nr:thioredoxin family protein [Hyphomicrobiaceae bacterium]
MIVPTREEVFDESRQSIGAGCKRCVMTAELIEDTAKDIGVDVHIEKVTDMAEIAKLGVVSTPGVMVDGKVVHAGGTWPSNATCSAQPSYACVRRLCCRHIARWIVLYRLSHLVPTLQQGALRDAATIEAG